MRDVNRVIGLVRGYTLITPPPTPKEMAETNFRKIDIDAYDEDVLVETELYNPDPRGPAQILSDTKQKTSAVRSALSKYNP